MKSSETSAKYSWPRREQKLEIQDSGDPDEVDMMAAMAGQVAREAVAPDEAPGGLGSRRGRKRGREADGKDGGGPPAGEGIESLGPGLQRGPESEKAGARSREGKRERSRD